MIKVGVITGAHGLGGAVKVTPLTDVTDRFDPGSTIVVGGAPLRIEWSRDGHPGLVVKFEGMSDRTLAELHRGEYIEVNDSDFRPPSAGQFLHHEVIGLQVETQGGVGLGTVDEILTKPANDVWVVRSGSAERLIPAVADAIVEVDLKRRRVVVADWLIEVEEG